QSAGADFRRRTADPEPRLGPQLLAEPRGDDDPARQQRHTARRRTALTLDRARDAHRVDLVSAKLGHQSVERIEHQRHGRSPRWAVAFVAAAHTARGTRQAPCQALDCRENRVNVHDRGAQVSFQTNSKPIPGEFTIQTRNSKTVSELKPAGTALL